MTNRRNLRWLWLAVVLGGFSLGLHAARLAADEQPNPAAAEQSDSGSQGEQSGEQDKSSPAEKDPGGDRAEPSESADEMPEPSNSQGQANEDNPSDDKKSENQESEDQRSEDQESNGKKPGPKQPEEEKKPEDKKPEDKKPEPRTPTPEEVERELRRFERFQQEQRNRKPGRYERNAPAIRDVLKTVVQQASLSTVRVFCDGQEAALGTIVESSGYVITKGSELSGTIECKLQSGPRLPASIVGIDYDHDLAMLKLPAGDLPPVAWYDGEALPVGKMLASVGTGDTPIAIGVVSVAARTLPPERGYLGISFDPSSGDQPVIQEVMPGSAAEQAGLKVKDLITMINDKAVENSRAVINALRNSRPGQEVRLKYKRGEEEFDVKATLGSLLLTPERANRYERMNLMGGKLSTRREGFPSVVQHDMVLWPSDVGGPIVDLDGNVVGINIARAERVASYAIPAAVVQSRLEELKSGKLAPKSTTLVSTDGDEGGDQLQALQEQIERLQEQVADLEKQHRDAVKGREQLAKQLEETREQLTQATASRAAAAKALDAVKQAVERAQGELSGKP